MLNKLLPPIREKVMYFPGDVVILRVPANEALTRNPKYYEVVVDSFLPSLDDMYADAYAVKMPPGSGYQIIHVSENLIIRRIS